MLGFTAVKSGEAAADSQSAPRRVATHGKRRSGVHSGRTPRVLGAAAAAALLTSMAAGCGAVDEADSSDGDDSQSGPMEGETTDAAAAGGLCEHLTFDSLSEATGEDFSVAESGGDSEVTSCVVQTTAGSFPDVTLTKAQTATDTEIYEAEIPPDDSESIDDLGDSAYGAVRDAVDGGGPVVEVGWLAEGQMYSLRYTTTSEATEDEAAAALDGLIESVREIDASLHEDDEDDEDDED